MKHSPIQMDVMAPSEATITAASGNDALPETARRQFWSAVLVVCLLFIVAFVIRLPWLGNATYHEDEGFYLAVAKAMHHGAVPYVDVWDRKPMGLFVLYWLITFLPGNGVLAYQLTATFFAFGTAVAIYRIARRLYGDGASLCCGVVYLAYLPVLFGAGGQAPVFYNMFVALAALALVPAHIASSSYRESLLRGCVATLLCGLALTMKPTAVVESAFLGAVAAWQLLKRTELGTLQKLRGIAILIAVGILPTLVILGYFASIGALQTYWFATVQSQGFKTPQPIWVTRSAAEYLAIILLPLLLMSTIGWAVMLRTTQARRIAGIVSGWSLAAIGGFLLVPNFWDHYALPLLPPLSILAGGVFDRKGVGPGWAVLSLIWSAFLTGWPSAPLSPETQRQLSRLMQTVDSARHGGCVYMYEGPPIFYALTDACRVTSRIFPQHLALAFEEHAIGVDPSVELQRIIARRPAVITLSSKPLVTFPNFKTRAILLDGLHRYYRKVSVVQIAEKNRKPYQMEVWVLRDHQNVVSDF